MKPTLPQQIVEKALTNWLQRQRFELHKPNTYRKNVTESVTAQLVFKDKDFVNFTLLYTETNNWFMDTYIPIGADLDWTLHGIKVKVEDSIALVLNNVFTDLILTINTV